ncbi:NAD(+) diphosphatase [Nocardioides sp. KR10-350]|uniref:NAD(+) diphosphatase n=1 Tax=Nocardioides cheoyonin TaxID=3156615 RepID=UPI0032B35E1E
MPPTEQYDPHEPGHVHEQLLRSPHDRSGHRRTDPGWLEERWADDTSRVLVVAGNLVAPSDKGVAWVGPGEAPDGVRVLLGERDGTAHFAVLTDREYAGGDWLGLRGLFPALVADSTDASLLLHAIGLAEWHAATRFCSRCGEPVHPAAEGHELVCANGHQTFPRTDPAVIMIVTDGEPGAEDERCLLGHHARWPAGRFSTLAGFCEPGESLEDAVRREVAEETGVLVGEVTYFGNQPWPLPASLMLGFTGRARTTDIECDEDEIADARWFTRADLKAGAESGEIMLPSGVSISRSLVEAWYGGPLPGSW